MTATHSPTTEPTAPREAGREDLVWVDPADLVLGANVRGDTRPDAKDFAASIKARGVLEAITASRDDDGHLVVLRGQRRAVVAATVGTPTDTVPVRVIAPPTEQDRIVDQLSENLHRAPMHDAEVLGGVEQLALVGVSPAQIAKRTALARVTVDAALAVASSESSRRRVVDDGLTLEAAAVFAEFERDPAALDRLEQQPGGVARWTTLRSGSATMPPNAPRSPPNVPGYASRDSPCWTPTTFLPRRTTFAWPTCAPRPATRPDRGLAPRPRRGGDGGQGVARPRPD